MKNFKKGNIMVGALALTVTLGMTSAAFAANQSDSEVVTVEIEANMTLACDASVDVNGGVALTADGSTVGSNTTTCAVTTNSGAGYHLDIVEDTQLNDGNGHTIPNLTAWNGSNAAQYPASGTNGLAFRVSNNANGTNNDRVALWGADTTCGNKASATELYAGLPSSTVNILEENDYVSTTQTSTICYMMTAAATQPAGTYTGQVTYTATTDA